jgi:broad specificity phosphatase PhoE
MNIILARHGKPNLPIGAWITPRQMKEWIQHYNQANVLLEDIPPETIAVAESAGLIVSSTSRRCIQSAQYLSQGKDFLAEDVFCEADLPYPSWHFPRLPLAAFGVTFRLAWFYGFSSNAESLAQARVRAHTAAKRLIELAREHDSVFLMGHGVMTILIAKHLLAWGWIGPKRPVNKHWQFSLYQAEA